MCSCASPASCFFIQTAIKFHKSTSVKDPVNFSAIQWLSALTHTDTSLPDLGSFWQSHCLLWKPSAKLNARINFISLAAQDWLSPRGRPVSHLQNEIKSILTNHHVLLITHMTTVKLYGHIAQPYWTVSEMLFSVRVNKDESLDTFSKTN